ncbi:MAG: ParB N-terminal domain-containing protein [Syntrophales bacterium]
MKLYHVETCKLKPNPDNLFPPLPSEEYDDLKTSIAMHGIKEPLIVVPDENDCYTIQAGHNRWRAAKELSLRTVPCIESSPDMYEAVIETEIYRRMLSKEERSRFKTLKVQKQKELMEKHLATHLLPDLMELYQANRMSINTALSYAKLPESQQREHWVLIEQQRSDVVEVIVEQDPAEKERHTQEKVALTTQMEKLKEQLVVKEKDLKTLRSQQDKAREALLEKMEELKTIKEDAYKQAGETLRKEVEKEVQRATEQVETYKTAVMEKNHEIDTLREENEKVNRRYKDTEGQVNAAWVSARVWRDDCVEHIKKLFAPEAMQDHLNAATHSVETVNRLLNGYNWDPTIRDKAMQELKRLRTRIDDLLQVLPNAASQLPQLPVPKKLQDSQ